MQVYDLSVNEKTNKSFADIDYEVVDNTNGKPAIHMVESADRTGGQITLNRTLPATNLHPGTYRLRLKVRDNVSRGVSEQSTTFTIE
jgi:5-hydroxyisourate hydrolase-like protein (transthyretin family)